MLIQQLVDMSVLKIIIILILTISLIVFVALFGRLPAFRRTPIAFLHRLLTRSLPNVFIKIDTVLTGRRLSRGLYSVGHYLMYEKHPLVLVFFVLLQTGGEAAMVPALWPSLSIHNKLIMPIAIALPHYFLYRTATKSSAITLPSPPPQRRNPNSHDRDVHHSPSTHPYSPAHHSALHAYPYDYLLYHPGYFCSTCHIPKPPRSKHCSLCRACIQKADHHCIWVNNCVGRNNYLYFLLLLVAITFLLIYGTSLGWTFMRGHLVRQFTMRSGSKTTTWAQGTSWGVWFDRLAWAMMQDVRVGATTLLCAMTTPLGGAFLVYHAYLLWAGMTTNEQGKWSDWKEDVSDGVVFRARLGELRVGLGADGLIGGGQKGRQPGLEMVGSYPSLPKDVEPRPEDVDWPPGSLLRSRLFGASRNGEGSGGTMRAEWWFIRTKEGDQPALRVKAHEAAARGVAGGDVVDGQIEVDDYRWQRVKSMRKEMDNIYDLGFWGNLLEVFYHRD